jgi:hypothetical protein
MAAERKQQQISVFATASYTSGMTVAFTHHSLGQAEARQSPPKATALSALLLWETGGGPGAEGGHDLIVGVQPG